MASNCTYCLTTAGILKSTSICLIAMVLCLSSIAHFTSEYTKHREHVYHLIGNNTVNLWREVYQITAATVCLIFSIANLSIHMLSKKIYWNKKTSLYDSLYHTGTFILLGSSGILYVVSAVKIFDINCKTKNGCQEFELKLASGALSMVASLICAIIASVVWTNRKEVQKQSLLSDT